MNFVKVLNVGQGDSIVMRPPQGCCYAGKTFFIDLGPGNTDITKGIGEDEKIHIWISHHDKDHIGGLSFFAGKFAQIEEITVPYFQNEITLIARAILNLKGINSSKNCGEFIHALEEIVNNQVVIKSLVEGNKACPRLSYAYEGYEFCTHIECLNPPRCVEVFNWIAETDTKDLIEMFNEVFSEPFAREMQMYIYTFFHEGRNLSIVDSATFNEFWLYGGEEQDSQIEQNKCNYVVNFLFRNMSLFRSFNTSSTRANMRKIYNKFVNCTHDVCMVLMVDFCNQKMLLTGDASKKVFNRLIREGIDISASYLKMPHHGSKHNISERILKCIRPEVAIISHDNGHFGKSQDTHPNMEVLECLQRMGIKILLTNDVRKNGQIIMKKQNHNSDSFVAIL